MLCALSPLIPSLFTMSLPSGGLLPRKCFPPRTPPPRGGLAAWRMTHALSLTAESSLFKELAGEGAKFKARLPEKITCHVKVAAV